MAKLPKPGIPEPIWESYGSLWGDHPPPRNLAIAYDRDLGTIAEITEPDGHRRSYGVDPPQ